VLFNAAAEKMFRCSQADALGNRSNASFRLLPGRHSGHDRQLGKSGSANRDMGDLIALWALRADGEKFEIEATISAGRIPRQSSYLPAYYGMSRRANRPRHTTGIRENRGGIGGDDPGGGSAIPLCDRHQRT